MAEVKCKKCDGTGKRRTEDCRMCAGTGRVNVVTDAEGKTVVTPGKAR